MFLVLVLVAAMQLFAPNYSYSEPGNAVAVNDSIASPYVTVDNIVLLGNSITKDEIILRELDVQRGQTIYYEDLLKILKEDQQRVTNLRLFNTVKVEPVRLDDGRVLIVVEVTERWYIFPVPIFTLIDRNFNVWWENQNRDLSRVNYGLKLYQRNFRGRNERLKLTMQLGYTRRFGISYTIPYLDESQKHGLIIDADFSENKNIAYKTEGHIQEFFDSEQVLRSSFRGGAVYVHRGEFFNFHYFSLKYINTTINDTIAALNPNYFLNGQTQQQYFEAYYRFVRDRRDVQAYPLNGHYIDVGIYQFGLGVFNDLSKTDLRAKYTRYFDLNKNWYFSNHTSGYLSLQQNQPYHNYYGLGYSSDFVRGYELYLIEGPKFLLNKSTLKKRILSIDEKINNFPLRQFRHFPLDIYLKTYLDWGYVENFENYGDNIRLADSYLVGSGIGLDIHTLYDMVIRLEYSVNRDKETGFYFHFRREF
ncbi:MAG: BamA/TamA family outer membrane protein [Candidatus Cyclobacteriaceae bacterium M2_1C_046]